MDMNLQIPWGYNQTYKSLGEIKALLESQNYHPNFLRCFIPWLHSKGGQVGVGGTRREFGSQPNLPGFAPEGKSFHQPQTYSDGWTGPSAIDLVAKDGPDANFAHDSVTWAMVPKQGTAEATKWGVHCNIDSEAWHIQGINIDGYDSWVKAGRPVPVASNYPIPTDPVPVPSNSYVVKSGDGWINVANALGVTTDYLYANGHVNRNGQTVKTPPLNGFVLWPGDYVVIGQSVERTYQNTAPPPPTLRRGDTGNLVTQLQIVLRVGADGIFGQITEDAVKFNQRNLGVTVDGIYGPQTDAALRNWLKSVGLPY